MKYFSTWAIYSAIYILIISSPIIAQYVSISPDSIAGKFIDFNEFSRLVKHIVYFSIIIAVVCFLFYHLKKDSL